MKRIEKLDAPFAITKLSYIVISHGEAFNVILNTSNDPQKVEGQKKIVIYFPEHSENEIDRPVVVIPEGVLIEHGNKNNNDL